MAGSEGGFSRSRRAPICRDNASTAITSKATTTQRRNCEAISIPNSAAVAVVWTHGRESRWDRP